MFHSIALAGMPSHFARRHKMGRHSRKGDRMKHRTPNIEPGTSKRELRKIRIKFLAACLVTFATAFTSLEVLSKPGDESNAAPNVVFDAVCKALQENYPM